MTILSALGLLSAMLVLALTPGPGVFAVLGRAMNSGFKKSLFLIAGIVSGDLVYLTFALTGLTWVARNVNWVFTLIRILGGLYLIYLGIRAFLAESHGKASQTAAARTDSACYMEGLIITLSNPKVILFYCSFLPAFMDLKSIRSAGFITAALIVSGTLSLVMTGYALLAVQGKRAFRSEMGSRILNRTGGSLMITAGTCMIVKH